MTRQQFLKKVALQLELYAAQHQVRNVVAMVRQGVPAEQIADVVAFGDEWNAKAVTEGLRQVEDLLDHRLRGGDTAAARGTEWMKELLDLEVEQYDASAAPPEPQKDRKRTE